MNPWFYSNISDVFLWKFIWGEPSIILKPYYKALAAFFLKFFVPWVYFLGSKLQGAGLSLHCSVCSVYPSIEYSSQSKHGLHEWVVTW